MALVEARDLVKRFGSLTAVDGITFSVQRGEVVGFLGPNGAGKSTAMKIISGFLQPTSGQAWIDGHDSHADPIAARRHLGYLPEGAPAYADMTVAAFLEFMAAMHGMSKAQADARLGELVERVDLADVWNQRIEALSKGFKRRVGIAQALVHDPDALILDEPTDGLDPIQKYEMRDLIRSHRGAEGDHHLDPHAGRGRGGLHPRHHHRQGAHARRCDAGRIAGARPGEPHRGGGAGDRRSARCCRRFDAPPRRGAGRGGATGEWNDPARGAHAP